MLKTLKAAEKVLLKYVPPADSQKSRYTLDRMRAFMDFIGNPQEKIKIIHVAGTSGKTSTSYFLAELLEQAGLKVGLTVSPHIDKVSERVQINGEPMPDAEFAKRLGEFIELSRGSGVALTYFELLMAFAYSTFADVKVDVAVVETGLGGLLDASNVVKNRDKTCIITDVGFDHTDVLGNRLEDIATQKAGIIQSGNQVFLLSQPGEVEAVIQNRCQQIQATLNMLREQRSPQALPLFQRRNFSLAEQVAQAWLDIQRLPRLNDGQLELAAKIVIPARMEELSVKGKTVILDGAHNAQKMEAFVNSFKAKFPNKKATVLLAVKSGKDHAELLSALLPITDKLIITGFVARQDMPVASVEPDELARDCDKLGFNNYEVIRDYRKALDSLLAAPNKTSIVTGSLYLISFVRPGLRQHGV